jgi:hypothetical protein
MTIPAIPALQQPIRHLPAGNVGNHPIAREGPMPADDIVAKAIPAMGVVVIAGQAPAFGPESIVPSSTGWPSSLTSWGSMTESRKPGLA